MTEERRLLWAPWRLEYIKSFQGPRPECFLCEALEAHEDRDRLVLYREETAFVIMNRYPYNNGHLLISPNRHIEDLDDLSIPELTALFDLTRRAKNWLRKAYNPDGFNIGINQGRESGAGLPEHLHVHVVPRWDGDTNFMPVLGFTKVISQGLHSSYDEILEIVLKEESN